jgi:ribosome-binding factor A
VAQNRRLERVGDLLREVTSEVIRQIKDPAVGSALVSITRVDVSSDLSYARFFVSVMADKDQQKLVLEGLTRASGFVRHQVKQQVHLKRVPSITFELDHSLEYGSHMNQLFAKIPKSLPEGESDLAEPDPIV